MADIHLPNPFRKEGYRTPPPAPVGPKDYARLTILILGFGFVVMAMAMFHKFIKQGFEDAAARKQGKDNVKINKDKAGPDETNARYVELVKLAKPFSDDTTPTDITAPYFLALLDFITEREIGDLIDRRVAPVELAATPEKLRGRVLRFSGTLRSSRKLALQKPSPKGTWTVAEQQVDIPALGSATVFTPTLPEIKGENPTIAFTGAFLRLVQGPGAPQLVFFARDMIPEAPPAPPPDPKIGPTPPEPPKPQAAPIDENTLRRLASEFKDGDDPLIKESQAFLAVMGSIHDAPGESVTKLLTGTSSDLLLTEADKHRGEVVRIRGQLTTIYTEKLDATVPQNIDHMFYCVMRAYPKNTFVHFYLSKWPEGLKLKPFSEKYGRVFYRDWIEIEGVFLRSYTYEGDSKDGSAGPRLTAALLMAKDMRLIAGPKLPDARGGFVTITFAIAGILILTVLSLGVWSRRFSSKGASLRMEMAQIRIKRGEKLEKLVPVGDPGKQVLGDEIPKEEPKLESPPPPPPA